MIVPDGADLLSLGDLLTFPHRDPVKMGVEGIGEFQLFVFDPSMADHHDISPGHADVARQHHHAVSDGIHRFSKAFGATPVGEQPVLAEMPPCTESARLIKTFSSRGGHREIESIRRFCNDLGMRFSEASAAQEQGRDNGQQKDGESGYGHEFVKDKKPSQGVQPRRCPPEW